MKEPVKRHKVFSDDNKKKETLDFQTEHMKNKIKNVKKKKKMLNIQNIEPLVNIHETSEEDKGEPIIEGLNLNPVVSFKDDEWTGDDGIYEGGNKNSSKIRSLADIIEDLYRKIIEKYHNLAYGLTKIFSGDTFHEDDVKHIKKYISWFLSIIVASIAVYNWIFLMFFTHDNCLDVKVWKTPRDFISNSASLSPFYRILDKFTNIPLFFPEYFKQILCTWIPNFIKSNIDDPGPSCNSRMRNVTKDGISKIVIILIFMLMLVSFTFLANSSGEIIKNMLVDIAKFEFDGPLTIFIYVVTMILFIMTFIETNPFAAILPVGGVISFFKYSNPVFWFEKIIILVFLIFAGVPIATALCLLYILSYTFLAIPLYKGSFGISEIKVLIDEYLDLYKPTERKDTPCNPLGFFGRVINYIIKISNYIYDNCIQLGFVIIMLYALIDSGINLKSNNLKIVTMVITIATMILVAMYSILSIIKEDDTTVDSEEVFNTESPIMKDNSDIMDMKDQLTNVSEKILNKGTPIINTDAMNTIKENIKFDPDLKDKITNISENLNLNDNKKLQEGLSQGVNMLSNMMKK